MSSLVTVRRHLSVLVLAPVVILGVLAMHGLSSTDAIAVHHAAAATASTDHGHHDERDPSDTGSDAPLHLGMVCTLILATGAVALLGPWRSRFVRWGNEQVPTHDMTGLDPPPKPTSRFPGFASETGLLRC